MVAIRDVQRSLSPPDSTRLKVLVVASAGRACALRLQHVREIMRPLPIEPLGDAPPFVLGLALVRGATLPVVELASLLGGASKRTSESRYVTLELGTRAVALAVDQVRGIRELVQAELAALPALVDGGASSVIESLATHDHELLRVLRASSILPEATWAALSHPHPES